MLTTKTNFHYSKLPELGEVGYITEGKDRLGRELYWMGQRQKFIVESFPLCDNVRPWSVGIHTAIFRRLKDGVKFRFSGFYFKTPEEI